MDGIDYILSSNCFSGPTVKYQGDLVSAGLKILKDDPSVLTDIIEAKQVEIRPLKKAQATNETLEVRQDNSSCF